MTLIKVNKKMEWEEAKDLANKLGIENDGFKPFSDGVVFDVPDTTREEIMSIVEKAGYKVAKRAGEVDERRKELTS
jgi:hypothetical protein